ncbi:entry exclusion lipoprotein TrbK [Chitinophaga dinghuensis]|uniref:Entry exclusion lipoprotein TrbK n=1 Tax=Chitinophaga dinghuensis TaxID=1539050 RepID=A0A327VN09_9BACT|nr:cytochrome c [Chitinophaga dinghuensis]RAJ75195.1 entry exclusion lipoprotein TrbK [Chitinophaga dinghuensis]
MKTLLQFAVIAVLLWGCSKSTVPTDTAAKTEAAFAKYPDSPGKEVYRENCNRCHAYKWPETRSVDKWPSIIDRMAKKARLSEDQKAAVLDFVKTNAKAS